MPVLRQKSRKFVQQPIATCWQWSMESSDGRSTYEPARPPSLRRDSNRSTVQPRGASAAAAANPANPPPTMATRGVTEGGPFAIVALATHEKDATGQPQLLR